MIRCAVLGHPSVTAALWASAPPPSFFSRRLIMRSGEAKSLAKGAYVFPYGNNQASPERGGVITTRRVAMTEGFPS